MNCPRCGGQLRRIYRGRRGSWQERAVLICECGYEDDPGLQGAAHASLKMAYGSSWGRDGRHDPRRGDSEEDTPFTPSSDLSLANLQPDTLSPSSPQPNQTEDSQWSSKGVCLVCWGNGTTGHGRTCWHCHGVGRLRKVTP